MGDRRCIIFSGGNFYDTDFHKDFIDDKDYIICVDGGLRYAKKIGIIPHLLIGDFDTINANELELIKKEKTKVIQYPGEKDYTDTHIALLKAIELGYKKIIMFAALGGRIDHTIANIMLLAIPEAEGVDVRIIEKSQEMFIIRKKQELNGKYGQLVSLLPMSNEVKGISTVGLYYGLTKATMNMGVPIGISNIMTKEKASVEIDKGLLLAIYTKEEK